MGKNMTIDGSTDVMTFLVKSLRINTMTLSKSYMTVKYMWFIFYFISDNESICGLFFIFCLTTKVYVVETLILQRVNKV